MIWEHIRSKVKGQLSEVIEVRLPALAPFTDSNRKGKGVKRTPNNLDNIHTRNHTEPK